MNTAREAARERYRSHLEEHLDSDELLELARLLEIELAGEIELAERSALVESIVGRIEDEGVLESLLVETERSTLDLLVELLDLGEVHPPSSFHSERFGLDPEQDVDAEDFFLLKRIGLASVSVLFDRPLLALHPLARHLLGKQIETFRRERFERERPRLAPSIPLRQLLAIAANHIRGSAVRLTARGELHRRHLERAAHLLEPVAGRNAAHHFELAVAALLHLRALRVRADSRLEVVPGGLEAVLTDTPAVTMVEGFLARGEPGSNTATGLLELLHEWSATLPGGWATLAHVQVNGELLLLAEGVHPEPDPGPSSGSSPGAAGVLRRKLAELVVLGLVEEAVTESGESWYRLSGSGQTLLERIAEPGVAGEGDVAARRDDVPGAIIQPNFDIIVGLDANAEVHWRVGAVARLGSVDRLCRYTIDREHTRSVFSREGGDGKRWIEALAACAAHEIPESIERTLGDWIDQLRAVEMLEGTVVRLPEKAGSNRDSDHEEPHDDGARAALREAAERLGARQLDGNAIFIPSGIDRDRVIAALNDQGLCPEGARRDFDPPAHDPGVRGDEAIRILRGRLHELRRFQEIYLHRSPAATPDGGPGTLPSDTRDETRIEARPGWVEADSEAISALLHAAVRGRQTVEIVLDDSYLNRSRRMKPETVMRRGTRTYVTGICLETDENRAFPLQAIVRARVLAEVQN